MSEKREFVAGHCVVGEIDHTKVRHIERFSASLSRRQVGHWIKLLDRSTKPVASYGYKAPAPGLHRARPRNRPHPPTDHGRTEP